MELDGRLCLLALQRLFFRNPLVARRLLEAAGSAAVAFAGDRRQWREHFDYHPDLYDAFVAFDGWGQAERDLVAIERCQGQLIGLGDPAYPMLLREIPDPPPVLVAIGRMRDAFERPAVAIVGSRLATRRGLDVAASIAEGLAAEGYTVVSGMAFGIDAAAHRGALAAGGPTVAVQGCGPERFSPRTHARLAAEIEASGLRLTEFPVGEPPYAANFPQRNRVISGCCLATVVVEAAEMSGSLITARLALEQDREVFAVPGPAGSQNARGVHRLIRDGAALVEAAQEVLELVSPLAQGRPFPQKAGQLNIDVDMDSPLLRALNRRRGSSVDEIVRATRLPAPKVLAELAALSVAGLVEELPGRRWRLKGT